MSTDKNLPCPFCGGACDPEGWSGGGGTNGLPLVRGPECEQCGATTDTIEDWNRRASPAAAVPEGALPPLPEEAARLSFPKPGPLFTAEQMQAYALAAVEADRAQRPENANQLVCNSALRAEPARPDFSKFATYEEWDRAVTAWSLKAWDCKMEGDARCRAEGGDGAVTDYGSLVDNSADRAQQGEPVAAGMRECPDCEGSAKISANEWCERCDRSGILPAIATKAAAPADAVGPGLDADEMTRVRRLMRALGMTDVDQRPDSYVRGILFSVLGQAAGRIDGAAPVPDTGIPTAGEVDVRYEFEKWMSSCGEAVLYIGDGQYSSGAVNDMAEAFAAGVELASRCRAQGGNTSDIGNPISDRSPISTTPTSGEVEKAGFAHAHPGEGEKP